ncbi:MAG TPA: class I SAM-dependent methyltransferase [Chitinophagaceae bacterium]|jgi:predicted O-methyltransferase YrrM|nr:class I SAM-dependent methyltransferase [Chitinophagaceae bacterium]
MTFELRIARKYLRYLLQSNNRHAVHSPFVYALIEDVLRDRRKFYAFSRIEKRRKELLKDHRLIKITDLGAGSSLQRVTERRVWDLAKYAAKAPKYGRLLFRLVNHFQPGTILELGTSLGISTAYLASARTEAQVWTLEGCPEISDIAKDTFSGLELQNIRMIPGNFDDTLAPALRQLPRLDMAFIDGNHRKEPTLRYFSQCLTQVHEDSVLIFDDIHWTREMESAWKQIKAHPSVTLSIDVFFMGVVFFKKSFREKQDFTLRY